MDPDQFSSGEANGYHGFLRLDRLPHLWNDICRDRANIIEDGSEYWNHDSSPIAIPPKWFSSDSCRIRCISVDASTRATF
jgi:hypothetical protein